MKPLEGFQAISKAAAENASQALAKLTGKPVSVEILKAEMRPVTEFGVALEPEALVTAIYLPITGDVRGASLLVFPKEVALNLCDVLLKRPSGTTRALSELGESALKEVGNIIAGSYLTVLANKLQIKLVEHIPSLSSDMYGAVLDQATSQLAERVEQALVLEVRFNIEAVTVEGRLFLLLAMEAIEAMVRSLEVT